MVVEYFKRIRMRLDGMESLPSVPLPHGYHFIAWDESLTGVHADVKFRSFHSEVDSRLFPCLGDRFGCLRLMREIRRKPGFLAGATWLVAHRCDVCGTVQGVVEPGRIGAIQNLGVVPRHRGRGLGRALLLQSLHGFRREQIEVVDLEVTADNDAAVRLYEQLGFQRANVLYKAVEFEPEVGDQL